MTPTPNTTGPESIVVRLKNEVWSYIDGTHGCYQISSLGRVRRFYKNGKVRILKPSFTKGYAHVTLSVFNEQRTVRIARLVAETFIDNPERKPEVNHKDGNKANDWVCNLEWATESENSTHAYEQGLRKATAGTKNGQAKLTEEKVNDIRSMYHYRRRDGLSIGTLAWMFEVSRQCISDIVHYRRWKHLPPPPSWE